MSNIRHPRRRLPVRRDFPVVQNMSKPAAMFETFERECFKHLGKIPSQLIVAWPHKNPLRHKDIPPDNYVDTFVRKMRKKYPQMRLFLADGLFEQHKIDRALDVAGTRYSKRQQWSLSKKFQTQTLPPLKGANVVILDDACETGATFADFISMLTHNGAHVLMGAVPSVTRPVTLQFEKTPEEDGRIKALDADMRLSARKAGVEMRPGECTELIERALNKKGYSLRTLTRGEFQEMRDEFDPKFQPLNFFVFLDEIGGRQPQKIAFTLKS